MFQRNKPKKPLKTISVVLCLLIALYAGYWFSLARSLEYSVSIWQKNISDNGGTFTFESLSAYGFPFGVNIDVHNLSVAQSDGTNWNIPLFQIKTNPIKSLNMAVYAPQKNRLTTGKIAPIPFTMDFDNFSSITSYDFAKSVQNIYFSVQNIEILSSGAIKSEDKAKNIPNMRLDNFGFDIDITPPFLSPNISETTIRNWQSKNGTLELKSLSFNQGNITTDISGKLNLTPSLQPHFKGNLSIIGLPELLSELQTNNTINETISGIVLGFAKMLNNGVDIAPNQPVNAPVTLGENKILSVGPFPIFKIPNINWATATPSDTTKAITKQ